MLAMKRLDGIRNWIKGRTYSITSIRCRRFLPVFVVVAVLFILIRLMQNFKLSRHFGDFHIDQGFMCSKNRLSHWKEAIESKDAIVLHNPLTPEENNVPLYVGNGFIGISMNGNRKIHLSNGDSISEQIPFEPLLTFSVEDVRDHREATVFDLRRGLIHNIHTYTKEKRCVMVEHVIYADQNKPNLLVQEIIVNNHAAQVVRIKFKFTGHKHWKKTKTYGDSYQVPKPGSPNIHLTIVTSVMRNPREKDSPMIIAVGSSSIPPTVMVPFESVKSLYFLTAVYTKVLPQEKSTPKPGLSMMMEKELRGVVVQSLKDGITNEESLREEQSAAWRKIWKSGVTVPINHHPDTPEGKDVNITMYYVLSNLNTSISEKSTIPYPGTCYQGVPTMHRAMLWTKPKNEKDVSALAMLWRGALLECGCQPFLDRGAVFLHQAMVLSFGGFTFSHGHLEFAANPATLQTDISFHHIDYYGNDVSVQVLISRQWGQAAEIKVWAESQGQLFACEAGCQINPVVLNPRGMTFPVKITHPVTPLLYISNNQTHLLSLRDMDFIKKVGKEVRIHTKHSPSIFPATFWLLLAFLIIVFHLYLVRLIYTECNREVRNGRFSR